MPPNARACPACGADEHTGWSERARYEELGLPDEEFNYDEFIAREFEGRAPPPHRNRWLWFATTVLLLAALAWWFSRR